MNSYHLRRHVRTKNVVRVDVSVRDLSWIPYERSNEHRRRTAFADPRRLTENEIRVAAKVDSARTVDCEVDTGIDHRAGGTAERAGDCQLEPGSAKQPDVLQLRIEKAERRGLAKGQQCLVRVAPEPRELRAEAIVGAAGVEPELGFSASFGTQSRVPDTQRQKRGLPIQSHLTPRSVRVEDARRAPGLTVSGAHLDDSQRSRPELFLGDYVRRTQAREWLKAKVPAERAAAVHSNTRRQEQAVAAVYSELRECTGDHRLELALRSESCRAAAQSRSRRAGESLGVAGNR